MKNPVRFLALSSVVFFASCGVRPSDAGSSATTKESDSAVAAQSNDEQVEKDGYSTFAYYQGIPAQSERSADRTDGTAYKMPCIAKEIIEAGVEKSYDFWHGHSGELHRFTLTVESLQQLKDGKSVEVYTAVVDGHKHAVKVDVNKPCKVK